MGNQIVDTFNNGNGNSDTKSQFQDAALDAGVDTGTGKKGRKIDPEILNKYLQIKKIMSERPHEFSRAELCKKHGVNYHNFSQWISKQQAKTRAEAPPRYRPVERPIVGQSVIVTTLDDILAMVQPLIKDAIRDGILHGIKMNKIKTLG